MWPPYTRTSWTCYDPHVIFAFHGYPGLVHEMLHGRPQAQRFHVRGFREEGTTTTPLRIRRIVGQYLLRQRLFHKATSADLMDAAGAAYLAQAKSNWMLESPFIKMAWPDYRVFTEEGIALPPTASNRR